MNTILIFRDTDITKYHDVICLTEKCTHVNRYTEAHKYLNDWKDIQLHSPCESYPKNTCINSSSRLDILKNVKGEHNFFYTF